MSAELHHIETSQCKYVFQVKMLQVYYDGVCSPLLIITVHEHILLAASKPEVAYTYASFCVVDVSMFEVPYAVVQRHRRRKDFRVDRKILIGISIGFPRRKHETCDRADLTVKGVVLSLSPVNVGSDASIHGLFHRQFRLQAAVAHVLYGFCEEAKMVIMVKSKQ